MHRATTSWGLKQKRIPINQVESKETKYGKGRHVELTDDPTDDVHDLVRDTGQYDRLLPQPGRSNLADQGVTDRAESGIVDQVEADEENTAAFRIDAVSSVYDDTKSGYGNLWLTPKPRRFPRYP
jgi:hypothetical protein